MSTPHPAAAPYAVLRVDRRKAKTMAAIAAFSAHTMREKPTPNADPDVPAPLVIYMADGTTPYQAARHLLDGVERRNRDTVLCREIVLSASPNYFRPGRESMCGVFDLDKVKIWTVASLAWAERQWPDQLASMVLHLDEQTPHVHLLVVPRVKMPTGVWKLNSKALFDRERLRELQTGYGDSLAPLGIRRGEPGNQVKHSEVRQFYGAVNAAKALPERSTLQPAPTAPEAPIGIAAGAAEALGSAFGVKTPHQRATKAHTATRKRWRETCKDLRQQDAAAWEQTNARSALVPLGRRRRSDQKSSSLVRQEVAPRSSAQSRHQ